MKNTIYFLLTLICLYAAACSSPSKEHKDKVQLVTAGSISLPISDDTYYESQSIFQFEENGKELLSFYNDKGASKILVYNLDNGQEEKAVPISKEGPNGMPGMDAAFPLSLDRFIVTSGWGRFWFINGKGEIERYFNFWGDGIDFNAFDHIAFISYTYMPAVIKDSVLYFSQEAIGFPRKKEEWKNIPMFSYADLKTGKFGWSDLRFPLIFDKDESFQLKYHPSVSYAYTGKELVVSLLGYDSIYVSRDFKHKRWHNAQSRYFPHIHPLPDNVSIDLNEMVRELGKRPKYLHLMYDKYRNVFYRFALMPIENKQPFSSNPEQEFSVIILNNQYEIIGETRFPGNTYNFRMCFVGKKGLYISENNINNPNFDENKLVFRCFTLEEAVTD